KGFDLPAGDACRFGQYIALFSHGVALQMIDHITLWNIGCKTLYLDSMRAQRPQHTNGLANFRTVEISRARKNNSDLLHTNYEIVRPVRRSPFSKHLLVDAESHSYHSRIRRWYWPRDHGSDPARPRCRRCRAYH